MRAAGRRAALAALSPVVLLAGLALWTARPADPAIWPPAPGGERVDIFLVSHGHHTGLALPQAALAETARRDGLAALEAVAARFADYPFVEIGWGEAEFYRSVRTVADLQPVMTLKALFRPGNSSVLHVVGLAGVPQRAFAAADVAPVALSRAGFARLAVALDASFERSGGTAQPDGPGLYGPSLFYRGAETFHAFNLCNHWTARMLGRAGLPSAPVLATHPLGLWLDLRWRAGIRPLPR